MIKNKLDNTYYCDVNTLMAIGNNSYQFLICCPRDCVSRHNGGTSGAPLKPPRFDSPFRALSTLRGLRGAPEVPSLCRETQSLGQQMLKAPVSINGCQIVVHATLLLEGFNSIEI